MTTLKNVSSECTDDTCLLPLTAEFETELAQATAAEVSCHQQFESLRNVFGATAEIPSFDLELRGSLRQDGAKSSYPVIQAAQLY